MLPQKIDSHTADELRKILRKVNITNPRVTIDFNNDTVELEDADANIAISMVDNERGLLDFIS